MNIMIELQSSYEIVSRITSAWHKMKHDAFE
jgi:hypothetical protein